MSRTIRRMPLAILTIILTVLLLFSCLLGLKLGYLSVSLSGIVSILASHLSGSALPSDIAMGIADAVWDLRLPRILLALAVGMGLSLSGMVMQAMFRNPMSDPYIMGVSSGASLGAASAVFFGAGAAFGVSAIGCGAFLGALVLSLILAIAAGRVAPGDSSYLLIFGAALAAVCGGITSVLVYIGSNATGMDVTLYWLMGSVSFAKLLPTLSVLSIVLVFIVFFSTQTRILNLMLEGEETAVPLGRQLLPFRRLYLVMNALLMGSLVTQAGLIGFVGLLVPHGCRMVMGADHRKLLPVSVLSGGLMTVWADILGRILIHGVDIPLGISLSLIGAPVFLGMFIRRSYHFGGEGA